MGNPVMHFEIIGKDAPALRTFYSETFGWEIAPPIPESPTDYSLVKTNNEHGIAGGIGQCPEGQAGHVTFYVAVDDMEKILRDIEARGGKRVFGPDQVPNGPIIGQFIDPQGNAIGLVQP